MSRVHCREHHSFFCPCVRPDLYERGFHNTKDFRGIDTLEKAQRAWDEAEAKRREKAARRESGEEL